ncbi:hypothetical protein AB0B67_46040, partial [Streptomyces spectabilis]
HRIKAALDYGRGLQKTWVFGGLRIRDGYEVTMAAPSRSSVCCQQFLQEVERANPTGMIWIVAGNLSARHSVSARTWLEDHPRFHPRWRLLARPPRGLVAAVPQDGPGWPVLRQPGRHRQGHRDGHHTAQQPCPTLDLGLPGTTDPPQATLLPVPSLRNAAIGAAGG